MEIDVTLLRRALRARLEPRLGPLQAGRLLEDRELVHALGVIQGLNIALETISELVREQGEQEGESEV